MVISSFVGSLKLNTSRVEEAVGVIRQAFFCFDRDGKGFVSATDISRVLTESGEGTLSEEVRVEYVVCLVEQCFLWCATPQKYRKYCYIRLSL